MSCSTETNRVKLNQINQIVMCPGGSLLDRTPISLRSHSTSRTSPILPGLTVITICPSTSPLLFMFVSVQGFYPRTHSLCLDQLVFLPDLSIYATHVRQLLQPPLSTAFLIETLAVHPHRTDLPHFIRANAVPFQGYVSRRDATQKKSVIRSEGEHHLTSVHLKGGALARLVACMRGRRRTLERR